MGHGKESNVLKEEKWKQASNANNGCPPAEEEKKTVRNISLKRTFSSASAACLDQERMAI